MDSIEIKDDFGRAIFLNDKGQPMGITLKEKEECTIGRETKKN